MRLNYENKAFILIEALILFLVISIFILLFHPHIKTAEIKWSDLVEESIQ